MILIQIAGALYACFAAGISAQLRRIEYRHTPALSYSQLALGAAVVLAFLVPLVVPLPAMFLGLFTSAIQALIFSTLAAYYIGEAVHEEHH